MRSKLLEKAPPIVKRFMAERGEPVAATDIAELLNVHNPTAYNVLSYMEAIGIVECSRDPGRKLYFLKGAYDEVRLASMLQKVRARAKRRLVGPRIKRVNTPKAEDEIPSQPPEDLLPALAAVNIYEFESIRKLPAIQAPEQEAVEEAIAVEEAVGEPSQTGLFITVEQEGVIETLPKDVRYLTRGDMEQLKEEHLKNLDGYEEIEHFNFFFAGKSEIEQRVIGSSFYTSMGTNPWDKVYRVNVLRRIGRRAHE